MASHRTNAWRKGNAIREKYENNPHRGSLRHAVSVALASVVISLTRRVELSVSRYLPKNACLSNMLTCLLELSLCKTIARRRQSSKQTILVYRLPTFVDQQQVVNGSRDIHDGAFLLLPVQVSLQKENL